MSVEQVQDETPVQADHVYVIPPNATLTIEGGILRVRPPVESQGGLRMSIDRLFQSLAEDQGHAAICLLFSGTGSDGTLGLRSVKEHGGMAMAQSPESAKHDTLLRSAIATGMVDHVLPPEEMPARLVPYVAHLRELHDRNARGALFEGSSRRSRPHLRPPSPQDGPRLQQLQDRDPRPARPAAHAGPAGALGRRLHGEAAGRDPEEPEELFRDLLIGVTQFFRDPEAFAAVAREVMPRALRARGSGRRRCGSGRPAAPPARRPTRVAILAREEMARARLAPGVQIFAGDIDDEALEFARLARYPDEDRRARDARAAGALLRRAARTATRWPGKCGRCASSPRTTSSGTRRSPASTSWSAGTSSSTSETDLQRHVTNLFHYAPAQGRLPLPGPLRERRRDRPISSAPSTRSTGSSSATRRCRCPRSSFPRAGHRRSAPSAGPDSARAEHRPAARSSRALERILLDQYAPAWVIVNAQGESIYFSPRTGRFLEPAAGSPDHGHPRDGTHGPAARPAHRPPQGDEDRGSRSSARASRWRRTARSSRSTSWCGPLVELGQDPGLFLVVFQELGPREIARAAPERRRALPVPATPSSSSSRASSGSRRSTCRPPSRRSRPRTRSCSRRTRSCSPRTRSSSRPTRSCQTSKEELQSVNEELETINAELGKKVEELDDVNGDLQNLLQSTRIPTVFLDDGPAHQALHRGGHRRLPPDRDGRRPTDHGPGPPLRGGRVLGPRGGAPHALRQGEAGPPGRRDRDLPPARPSLSPGGRRRRRARCSPSST